MYKVKYASLNYYPDIFLIPNIAVGVAFEVVGKCYNKKHFIIMPKKHKLFTFDDELDPEFAKLMLKSIKENMENFNGELSDFTFNYVNNFKFTSIKHEVFESLSEVEQFIDDTRRYILHTSMYENNKMTNREKKKYICKYLNRKYGDVKKSFVVKGKNPKDKITVDFMAVNKDGNYVGFKILNNSNQAMSSLRSFALHAMINKEFLTFILDENMEAEHSYIASLNQSNIKAIYRKDLMVEV